MSFTPTAGSVQNNSPYPDVYYECQSTGAPYPSLAAVTEAAFPSAYRAPGKKVQVQNGTKVDVYILDMNLQWQLASGTAGKSAYQIWLDAGNAGTQAQFLNSLIGPGGSDAAYRGQATTATNPGTPGMQVWYFASGPGSYTNFPDSNSQPLVITQADGWCILSYDGSSWRKSSISFNFSDYVCNTVLPDDFNQPDPIIAATTINAAEGVTFTDNYPNAFTFINGDASQAQVGIKGIIKTFFVSLTNAEVGRKVAFAVFSRIGNNFTCKSITAEVAAEAAGKNTISGFNVPVEAGDYIGVYVNFVSSANGLAYKQSGGNAISAGCTIPAKATAGNTYPLSPTTQFYYSAGGIVTPYAKLVSQLWKDQPGGYVSPTPENTLPFDYYNTGAAGPAEAVFETLNDHLHPVNNVYGGNFLFADVTATSATKHAGVVTRFFSTVRNAEAGRICTFYILKPGTGGQYQVLYSTGAISCPAAGEVSYVPTGTIYIPQGAFIGCRVVSASGSNCIGMYDSGGSATGATTIFIQNAVTVGGSYSVQPAGNYYYFPIGADVIYSSLPFIPNYGQANKANSLVVADESRNFPNTVGRAADSHWKGKKIVVFGTSIEAQLSGATGLSNTVEMGLLLGGAIIDNQAQGSSGIVWTGDRELTLSATVAELEAAFGSGHGGSSFELRMLNKNADLYLFIHGYNDRTYPFGTKADTTRATLWGAYKFLFGKLYEENALVNIAIIGNPPYRTTNNNIPNHNPEKLDELNGVLKDIAKEYAIPFFDPHTNAGINDFNKAQYLQDGVHFINGKGSRTANIYYNWLKNIYL